jgi:hypothetical protein
MVDARPVPTERALNRALLARQMLLAGCSVAETAAFAVGGWLYQGLGAVIALLIDAASHLLSALCLRGVPPALLARVDGALRTIGQVATLLGALAGGLLATACGARTALWFAALFTAAAAVAAWRATVADSIAAGPTQPPTQPSRPEAE